MKQHFYQQYTDNFKEELYYSVNKKSWEIPLVLPPKHLKKKQLASRFKNLSVDTPALAYTTVDLGYHSFEYPPTLPYPIKKLAPQFKDRIVDTPIYPNFLPPVVLDVFESPFVNPLIKHKRFAPLWYKIQDDGHLWEHAPATPEEISFSEYLTRYAPPLASKLPIDNQYIGPYTRSSDTIVTVALRAYYVPLIIVYPINIIELSVYITARDDDALARLGIFSIEQGKIDRLIYDNIIALNTLGVRTVEANVSLSPGAYAFVYMSNGTATVRSFDVGHPLLGYVRPDELTLYTHYCDDKSAWADGLSDNPDVILASGEAPHIYAKVR